MCFAIGSIYPPVCFQLQKPVAVNDFSIALGNEKCLQGKKYILSYLRIFQPENCFITLQAKGEVFLSKYISRIFVNFRLCLAKWWRSWYISLNQWCWTRLSQILGCAGMFSVSVISTCITHCESGWITDASFTTEKGSCELDEAFFFFFLRSFFPLYHLPFNLKKSLIDAFLSHFAAHTTDETIRFQEVCEKRK